MGEVRVSIMRKKKVFFDVATSRHIPLINQITQTNRRVGAIIGSTAATSTVPIPEPSDPQLPANVIILEGGEGIDDIGAGQTVYEVLSGSGSTYTTTLPVDCFLFVWFDGLEAFPLVHYTFEAGTSLSTNTSLISGTIVDARYTVAEA